MHQLNMSQVESMIALAVPDAVVDEVVTRTGGDLSTVFEVRFEASTEAVIVKVYDDSWAWKQQKEIHVYALLANGMGNSTPVVLHAEADNRAGPAFTVMTKRQGEPLSEVKVAASEWTPIYRQLGGLLRRIHTVAQPAYGYITTEVLEPRLDNESYMTHQFAKKLREFTELRGDPELHDQIESYVSDHRHLLQHSEGPVLCHNDFHEGNVLVALGSQGWRVTGFIDVENAIAADPLLDLAKTDCYSIRGDSAKLSGLVEGYGTLPDDWPERVELYRLYHALELWDWFASIGNTGPLPSIANDLRTIA